MIMKPTKYQQKALLTLKEKKGRALLAFKPGAGKSFTSLWFAKMMNYQNIVIVAPKSKLPEWETDCKKIFPNLPINYPNITFIYFTPGIFLTTYKSLHYLDGVECDCIIFDESTTVKEPYTQTFKIALHFLLESKPKAVLCLSGTPAMNHPYELWAQLKLINYDNPCFLTFEEFIMKYCHYTYDRRYNQIRFKGLKDAEGLKQFVDKYIIYLDKTDEAELSLPELTIKKILIPNKNENLTQKEIGMKKIPWVIAGVKKYFKNHKDPMVIFTWHQETSIVIKEKLEKIKLRVVIIKGDTDLKTREKILKAFNQFKIDVLICNLKAAGMGLNLQKAWFAIIAELYWNPKLVEQAIKRLHRKGQTKPVWVSILILENSNDINILKTWKRKEEDIAKIITA